jgi:hypothetical protein
MCDQPISVQEGPVAVQKFSDMKPENRMTTNRKVCKRLRALHRLESVPNDHLRMTSARRVVRTAAIHGFFLLPPLISLMLSGPASAQTVVRSFDGDKGIDLTICNRNVVRCTRQPEPNVAADGSRVVQVTVNNVNVYDYAGKLLRSTPFRKFIGDAGLDPNPAGARDEPGKGPFEPHAVFDKFIGRWIVTVTCLNDCFVVSASADPLGPWHGVYLSCVQGGPCLDFDPALHIGYDKNGVYYCGGHSHDEHPQTVPGYAYDCLAISGSEVKAVGDGGEPEHVNRVHNLPLDILPAVDDNPQKSPDAPAFFAARTCSRAEPGGCQRSTNFSFHWIIDTFTWNGPTGTYNVGGEQMVGTDIGSKQNKWLYNLPCCSKQATMPQKGAGIGLRAAESHRLINLVQHGTHLHGALGSGPCMAECGEQGADTNNVMFYVDFDCSNPTGCIVSQTAKITGAEVNPVFGTVGVDQDGNVGITALSSTVNTDLSILLWTHSITDPPNMFRGPMILVAGTQPYTCVNADNMALIASAVGILTLRDPVDGSKLWTTQQYGGNAKPCVWDTKVIEYQIGSGRREN